MFSLKLYPAPKISPNRPCQPYAGFDLVMIIMMMMTMVTMMMILVDDQ